MREAGKVGPGHCYINPVCSQWLQCPSGRRRSVPLCADLALGTAGVAFAQGTAPAASGNQDIVAAFAKADKNGDPSPSASL